MKRARRCCSRSSWWRCWAGSRSTRVATETAGSQGLQAGDALPPFAMPLSTSSCRGRCDANVATEGRPGRGGREARRAQVRGRGRAELVRAGRGRAVRARVRVRARSQRCRAQLPVLERVAARHRDVKFRIVAVRADAATARGLRLEPARRLRPRRRGGQRVRGRRLPDDHVRARAAGRSPGSTRRAARRGGARGLGRGALSAEPPSIDRSRRPGCAWWCAFAVDAQPAAALAAGAAPAAARAVGPPRRRAGDHPGARARSRRPTARHYGRLERSPAEELTLKRLIRGQYRSRGVLRDALLIATRGHRGRRLGARRGPPQRRAAPRRPRDRRRRRPLAPLFDDPSR